MRLTRNEGFRALLAERRAVLSASPADPMSARLAEQVGYEALTLLSSSATFAVLGAPDLSLLSLTEMAEQTRRIARATSRPILVDGEQGFGNALGARRTVEEIEAAGAAAVTIEDTVLPRAFGAPDGYQLVGLEEGRGRMRAALSARGAPSFVIVARTSAFSVADRDEALRRIRAYVEDGVDAVFLSGVRTLTDLEAARDAVAVPIIVGAVGPELRDRAVLAKAGVSLWAQGNQPLVAALRAMRQAYADILDGSASGAIEGGPGDPLMAEVTGAGVYKQWTKDFLS